MADSLDKSSNTLESISLIEANIKNLKDEVINSLLETAQLAQTRILQIQEDTIAKIHELEDDDTSDARKYITCAKDEGCKRMKQVWHLSRVGLHNLSDESNFLIKKLLNSVKDYNSQLSTPIEQMVDDILKATGYKAYDLVKVLKKRTKELKKELEKTSTAAKKFQKAKQKKAVKYK